MSDQYRRELLRIAVAQICQTIGYNATQTMSLELVQDILHKFLHEFSRNLRLQAEHFNRTEANLSDVCFTLSNLNINVNELMDYINNVEPVPFICDIPKFPVSKNTNLNFLKPGSKEVLTRPVHIYEHLPPILSSDNNSEYTTLPSPIIPLTHYVHDSDGESTARTTRNENTASSISCLSTFLETNIKTYKITPKNELNFGTLAPTPSFLNHSSTTASFLLDEEGRPTREISSVVMTSGGFISPAIEGKLPDTLIPDIIEKLQGYDALPPPLSPTSPQSPPLSSSRLFSRTTNGNSSYNANNSNESDTNLSKVSELKLEENVNKTLGLNPNNIFPNTEILDTNNSNENTNANAITAFSHIRPLPATKVLKKNKRKIHQQFLMDNLELCTKMVSDLNPAGPFPDKSKKKRLKMLQRLTKSAKLPSMNDNIPSLMGADGKFRGLINQNMATLPYFSERFHVEKLRKKQTKHKQKLLKQQMNSTLKSSRIEKTPIMKSQLMFSTNESLGPLGIEMPANVVLNDVHMKDLRSPTEGRISSINESQINKGIMQDDIVNVNESIASPYHTKSTIEAIFKGVNPKLMRQDVQNPKVAEEIQPFDVQQSEIHEDISTEIKLSTEPDRNKLNIFKKISKQKTIKSHSPSINKVLLSSVPPQIFSNTNNQIINLPSGTTITPAPPTNVGRHVYSPDDNGIPFCSELAEKVMANNNLALKTLMASTTPAAIGPSSPYLPAPDGKHELLNKPKKRGRRPGSKNQSKIPELITTSPSIKTTKKLKTDKNMSFPSYLDLNVVEPLNLTNSANSSTFDRANTFGKKIPNLFSMNKIQDETKDRKKLKGKKLVAPGNLVELKHIKFNSLASVPTKEEVNTINEKLMRIDTVLKSTPQKSTVFTKNFQSETPSIPNTSICRSSTTISNSSSSSIKKRATHQLNHSNIMAPIFISTCETNIRENLLSMLPMIPFQSRPGLIPTPGLFPTPTLGHFPNISKSSSTPRMLLPTFLPFPNLNQSAGKAHSKDAGNNDFNDNFSEFSPPQAGDRSYCNVAPFVPESMKLLPPEYLSEKQLPSNNKRENFVKILQSPIFVEASVEATTKKENFVKINESNKTEASTCGITLLNNFDALTFGKNSSRGEQSAFSINNIENNVVDNSDSLSYLNNAFNQNSNKILTQESSQIQANDPIEVSDDSIDAVVAGKGTTEISPVPNLEGSKCKMNDNSYLKNVYKFLSESTEHQLESDLVIKKDVNTIKKSNKIPKKYTLINAATINSPMNIFSIANKITDGLGKLSDALGKVAGGAELIPLGSTSASLATYPKTIPSKSLTVSTGTVSTQKDFETTSSSNIFENLTITSTVVSNTDEPLQKRRKERKKLKKLKDGKIKKKKDKKDKSKSKERDEIYIYKSEKGMKEKDIGNCRDKDLLKKIKKFKKKEKQRLATNSTDIDSLNVVNKSMLTTTLLDICNGKPTSSQLPLVGHSASPATPLVDSPSVIPKLTLKIGSNSKSPAPPDDTSLCLTLKSCVGSITTTTNSLNTSEHDKRELSPELARISPLVTRPPKQKLNTVDLISTSYSTTLGITTTSTSIAANINTLVDGKSSALSSTNNNQSSVLIPPPSPWLSGGTLVASSVLLPQQLLQSNLKTQEQTTSPVVNTNTVDLCSSSARSTTTGRQSSSPISLISETSRPSSYIDAEGNRVWICPACGKVDDGSAMIGCDGCDAWYHWICVGIFVAPKDNEDWFCRVCITRKKVIHGISDKKRKRNKKK